jgi:hypothetical protein
MTLVLISAVMLGTAQPVAAESGVDATFHDMIAEPPTWRVRYLIPALAGDSLSFADVADDMQRLCDDDALSRVTASGGAPERVVITLMSQPVDFGVMSPEVRQYFESYQIRDGRCIWEAF